jgi:hypothetical protein
MSKVPAAVSQGFKPSSQKPSTRPCGHVREVQRRRARPPQPCGLEHHGLEHGEIFIEVGRIGPIREASGDQRAFQSDLLADAHLAALDLGAVAARGGEDFLAHRVEHHRVLQPATDLAGDGHREGGKAVHEVRGAVERVDDPDDFVVARGAAFFGKDRVIRIQPADGLDDVGFGSLVDLGDEVVAALAFNLDGFEARDGANDDVTGAARGLDRNTE